MDRSQRFSREDVSDIVREALQSERDSDATLSYADLEDIAAQCGVDEATLARTLERRALDGKKQAIRRRWRVKALSNMAWPTLACLAFVVMNIGTGGFPWAIFPVLFWFVPTLSRCRSRLFPSDELLHKAAQRVGVA